ncbi:MAG: SGNH/GDSL hydrolase family protein, partial [Gammaproteobacteria bacterium]|nr:SGNH/GDSL hydrolase family protein [Gammaproteobacteria bacterium]
PDDTNPERDWVWRSAGFPVSKVKTFPFRILVMGDSFVWGDGYANFNDTLWRQLQRELAARGYHKVEVIAAGKNGASTQKQIQAARRILPDYAPDLVVWQYVTNDPDEDLVRQFDPAFLDDDAIASGLQRLSAIGVFPNFCRQMLDLRRRKVQNVLTPEVTGYGYEDWEYQILEGENFARYRETLAELASLQSESGKPFIMVPVPNSPDPNRERKYAPVRKAVTEAGIPWLETLPRLLRDTAALGSTSSVLEWGVNPVNAHPGIMVTHLIARQVADALERDHPEVLDRKTQRSPPPVIQVNQWRPWNLAVQDNQPGEITFAYPSEDSLMLRMPQGVPHVLLNLAMPVSVDEVEVSGDGLASARLYFSGEDPANLLDSHRPEDGGRKSGTRVTWQLNDAPRAHFLNSVAIAAEFASADRTLHVTFRRHSP